MGASTSIKLRAAGHLEPDPRRAFTRAPVGGAQELATNHTSPSQRTKTHHRVVQRAQASKSRSTSSLRRTSTTTAKPTTRRAPSSAARQRGSRRATSPRTRPTSAERRAEKDDLMTACASHLRASPDDDDRNLILKPTPAEKKTRLSRQLVAPRMYNSLTATPQVAAKCIRDVSSAPIRR